MKKIIFVVVVVFFAANVFGQDSGEISVPLSNPAKRGKLVVDIHYGGIVVNGTGRKDVLIKYISNEQKVSQQNEKDGLKRISSGSIDLEASENGNEVKVESSSWSKKTNLVIEIPSGFDVSADSYNDGDIVVNNIEGEVEINTYNGKISAEGITGSVVGSTYNGEVNVSFNKLKEGVPMSLSTYNGDINLTLPATTKSSFKMKTGRGEILSAFDMTMIKSGPIQKKDEKSGTFKVSVDEWVKGEINGGGAEISMRNYNGDLVIRKK